MADIIHQACKRRSHTVELEGQRAELEDSQIFSEESEGKKKTLKDERNEKKKATAGRDFNWSMLYMNVSLSILF